MATKKEEQALIDLKDFSEDNPKDFDKIIEKLNKNGFMTSLDTTSFKVETAEYWSPACSDFMKKCMEDCGYNGLYILAYPKYYGESTPGGKYIESSDYLYVLYDSEVWGSDEDESQIEAERFLDSEFDRWLENNRNF